MKLIDRMVTGNYFTSNDVKYSVVSVNVNLDTKSTTIKMSRDWYNTLPVDTFDITIPFNSTCKEVMAILVKELSNE